MDEPQGLAGDGITVGAVPAGSVRVRAREPGAQDGDQQQVEQAVEQRWRNASPWLSSAAARWDLWGVYGSGVEFVRHRSSDSPDVARCDICGRVHPVATMVTGHKKAEDVPSERKGRFPTPVDWWLANGEELGAHYPRSYFIPPATRRRALRVGELVRLQFVYGPHADREDEGHVERMWVEVLEQHPDGHAHGLLRNRPARLRELEIGDLLAFEPEHVVSIDYSDEELGYPQDQRAIADQAISRDDHAPDIVVRAPGPYSADRRDWWMLVRANPAGPTTVDVNSLTDRFPGLAEPLRAGDGLWERAYGERSDARWRRVDPSTLESSDEWQSFLDWLERTAQGMRHPPTAGPDS